MLEKKMELNPKLVLCPSTKKSRMGEEPVWQLSL